MPACTMPYVPWFRKWFNTKFNDLCEQHDMDYRESDCKLCSDWRFAWAIAQQGYWWLAPLVFLAVNLPWVWAKYFIKRNS